MLKTIYISGQITNLHPDEAAQNFQKAEDILRRQGWQVINPLKLNHKFDYSWEDLMLTDIKALFKCEAIFMLTNWKRSKGARIERHIANEIGLKVYYQKNNAAPSQIRIWWMKRLQLKEVRHA